MRGNSGFLRWLSSYCSATNQTLLIILVVTITSTHAVPLNTRHRRMIREVYSEFETQNITQPAEGTCLYDGTQVPETSVQCEKKAGCRAIQKTGYCCPDYQCGCERDGKFYANGEKLVDPETPCKGCYCQGGEILCNSVNCYIRNDCQPKYIAGRCCPEYDNCPPIESGRPHLIKETATTEAQSTPNASTDGNEVPSSSASSPSTTPKQEAANNNLGIKIKEITKPEEIRIIDEKPKPTYQLIKPFESTSSNQMPKLFPSSQSKAPEQPLALNSIETQLFPVKVESAPVLTSDTQANDERQSSNPEVQTSTGSTEPSSTSEPTIVQEIPEEVGKEVVIVDSNGQTKPITVFGVEGLQRGDVLDEISEYEEKKSSAKRSDSSVHSVETTTEHLYGTSEETEVIFGQSSGTDFKTVSEIDPVGSSSDDFIRILSTTKTADGSTGDSTTEGVTVTETGETFDTVYYTSGPDRLVFDDSISNISDTVYYSPETNYTLATSTEGTEPSVDPMYHPSLMEDDDTTSNEPNPAYPLINDDLSIYGTKVLNSEEDVSLKEEKILHDALLHKQNYTQDQNASTIVPADWLKEETNSSTTEGVLIDNVSDVKPEERSPGEPFLVPEWERNATESIEQNSTSGDSLEDESIERSKSLELDISGESGDGPITAKNREPTTPNSMNISLDIDEDGSGRVEHDPKKDSESLKYHEDQEAGPGNAKTPLDSGIQTIVSAISDFHKNHLIDILNFT